MNRSITSLAAGIALFPTAAHAHDHWLNGEPVPAWVKTGQGVKSTLTEMLRRVESRGAF